MTDKATFMLDVFRDAMTKHGGTLNTTTAAKEGLCGRATARRYLRLMADSGEVDSYGEGQSGELTICAVGKAPQ